MKAVIVLALICGSHFVFAEPNGVNNSSGSSGSEVDGSVTEPASPSMPSPQPDPSSSGQNPFPNGIVGVGISPSDYSRAHGGLPPPNDCAREGRPLYVNGDCGPNPYGSANGGEYEDTRFSTFCFQAEQHLNRPQSSNPLIAEGQNLVESFAANGERNVRNANRTYVTGPDGHRYLTSPEYNSDSWRMCPNLQRFANDFETTIDNSWSEGWKMKLQKGSHIRNEFQNTQLPDLNGGYHFTLSHCLPWNSCK